MEDQTNAKRERDRWGSRASFLMAAVGKLSANEKTKSDDLCVSSIDLTIFLHIRVGAAIGFGNVWRFPSLAYEYGGGAFFIPYLLALFFIGIPLVLLEVGLGQYHQTGDVGVFGSIHRRLKGVGLCSAVASWVVVTYYVPLIAWVINAFFDSFTNAALWETSTGSEAYSYFLDEIVGEKTLGADFRPTRMVWANVGYIALTCYLAQPSLWNRKHWSYCLLHDGFTSYPYLCIPRQGSEPSWIVGWHSCLHWRVGYERFGDQSGMLVKSGVTDLLFGWSDVRHPHGFWKLLPKRLTSLSELPHNIDQQQFLFLHRWICRVRWTRILGIY